VLEETEGSSSSVVTGESNLFYVLLAQRLRAVLHQATPVLDPILFRVHHTRLLLCWPNPWCHVFEPHDLPQNKHTWSPLHFLTPRRENDWRGLAHWPTPWRQSPRRQSFRTCSPWTASEMRKHLSAEKRSLSKTGFAGDSGHEMTFSKLPNVIQVQWKLPKQKDFYVLIYGSFNQYILSLLSNVSGDFGHKCRRLPMTRWRCRRK